MLGFRGTTVRERAARRISPARLPRSLSTSPSSQSRRHPTISTLFSSVCARSQRCGLGHLAGIASVRGAENVDRRAVRRCTRRACQLTRVHSAFHPKTAPGQRQATTSPTSRLSRERRRKMPSPPSHDHVIIATRDVCLAHRKFFDIPRTPLQFSALELRWIA